MKASVERQAMRFVTVPELIERLRSGVHVVLPSERAARELRTAFDAAQIVDGRSVWQPPQVSSWRQWTQSQWNQLVVAGSETRLLLNGAQEHSLWCDVLRDDPEHSSLSSVDSLADLAQEAWRLAAAYNVSKLIRDYASTDDCRTFAGWAEEFSKRCVARECLSAALLETSLTEHLHAGVLIAPEQVEVVGFTERLPAQDALLTVLREQGTDVVHSGLKTANQNCGCPVLLLAENELQELTLAGRWIRDFLEKAAGEGRNPRIAVLVPDLPKEQSKLDAAFRETLTPELQWVGADLSSTVWSISEGPSLASVSIISDALLLARWADSSLPLTEVTSLLLSPYFGSSGDNTEQQRETNARFDAEWLRRLPMLRPEIDIGAVVGLMNRAERGFESRGIQHSSIMPWLRNLHDLTRGMQERTRGFAEWMEFVRRIVQAAGWPGERPLDGVEIEANRAWEGLLDTIATLDFLGQSVTFAEALKALQRQAHKMTFKRPLPHAPVQVMGVREAEACVFDGVVLLRSTDRNWPEKEKAHPLLSWSLQLRFNMPGTDSVRSIERSHAFMNQIMERSGYGVFTCAMEDERGPVNSSALLDSLNVEHFAMQDTPQIVPTSEKVCLEEHADSTGLPALPSGRVAGGSAVLKLQAACGFLAFAEMRLRAKDLQAVEFGLDAKENGILLHRTLQLFWQQTESQDVLRERGEDEQEQHLRASIDAAVAERIFPRGQWDHAYVALQKERLLSLLKHWVKHELLRSRFSVLELERKQTVNVGPLSLEVRMDRVDRVDEGVVFVDYKSGYSASVKQWEGQRPDDPQLPVYTLVDDAAALKAIAFAKVRSGEDMRWEGFQNAEGILPKAKLRDLATLIEEWRGMLTQLAEDFAAGKAEVDPKLFERNCEHCVQRLLCRVDRSSLMMSTQEEVDGMEFIDG